MKHAYYRMLESINCKTFKEVSEYFTGLRIKAATVSNILRTGTIPGHMVDFMKQNGVDTHWLVHGSGGKPQSSGANFTLQTPAVDTRPKLKKTADPLLYHSREMPL